MSLKNAATSGFNSGRSPYSCPLQDHHLGPCPVITDFEVSVEKNSICSLKGSETVVLRVNQGFMEGTGACRADTRQGALGNVEGCVSCSTG